MNYRGKVYKNRSRNRWIYEVYENGELIARGDFLSWAESFAQASGTVTIYDTYFGGLKKVKRIAR